MINWKDSLSLMLLTYNDLPGCLATIDTWDKAGIRTPNDIAFINNSTPEYIKAIEGRGFRVFHTQVNMGIGYGIKTLVENCKTKYTLFLEHDWKCYVDKNKAENEILNSLHVLNIGNVDMIRLRHRTNYGEPLYSIHLKDNILQTHPHHLMDADHWEEDLINKYPSHFFKIEDFGNDFIFTSAEFAAYTNNPYITTTQFLKDNVLPYCEGHMNVVENGIQEWWTKQEFVIGKPGGIFTHKPGVI